MNKSPDDSLANLIYKSLMLKSQWSTKRSDTSTECTGLPYMWQDAWKTFRRRAHSPRFRHNWEKTPANFPHLGCEQRTAPTEEDCFFKNGATPGALMTDNPQPGYCSICCISATRDRKDWFISRRLSRYPTARSEKLGTQDMHFNVK